VHTRRPSTADPDAGLGTSIALPYALSQADCRRAPAGYLGRLEPEPVNVNRSSCGGHLLCPPRIRWVSHHLREGQQGCSPALPIARSNVATRSRVRLSSCSLPGTDHTWPGRNCGLGRFTESCHGSAARMRRCGADWLMQGRCGPTNNS